MEGRASNFKKVLADFEARLHGAEFVAIDTELTGVDLEGEPDTFEDSAQMRLDKMCRTAERYTLIQLGLTIVGRTGEAHQGHLSFASYNIYAFPYFGPELPDKENSFFCQASALQFNVQHRVNFNTWIGEGTPYMNRDDEQIFTRVAKSNQNGNVKHEEKIGLLRLWKALCAARIPWVVHCPLDLFFLLAAFERRPLPRNDPRALAMMIRQCTPKVFDTAHLHGACGRFKRLGLMNFFQDAKERYEEVKNSPAGNGVPHLQFELIGDTAIRYKKTDDKLAHEAGYDSLVTAQLFAYLRASAPKIVKEGANRLFLYRSVEFVDLERASASSNREVGTNMFDLTRVTLLVAQIEPDNGDAAGLIGSNGSAVKWMDSQHILVVLRASGGAAVRKAAELAAQVHGVISWMGFDEWRDLRASEAASASTRGRTRALPNGNCRTGNGVHDLDTNGVVDAADDDSYCSRRTVAETQWDGRGLGLGVIVAASSCLVLAVLCRSKSELTAAGARLLLRWRQI